MKRTTGRQPRRQYRVTKIRQWRQYRGYTLEALAGAVGSTHVTLSRLERGKSPYSQKLLETLAEALRTDPGSLINRDPPRKDDIWTVWHRAAPQQQRQIEEVAKALINNIEHTEH